MFRIKKYLLSKEFLISIIVMIGVIFINMNDKLRVGYAFSKFGDCFSYWNSMLYNGYGEYLETFLTILLLFASLKDAYNTLNGTLKSHLIREKKDKFLIKEFLSTSIKAYIPLFIVSAGLFIYASIKYPHYVSTEKGYELFYMKGLVQNAYFYVFLTFIMNYIFVCAIVNIGYFFMYITKKLYVSIISSYIFFILFDFSLQWLFGALASILNVEWFSTFVEREFNLIYGYDPTSNVFFSLCITVVFLLITIIPVYVLYRDKEKLVLNFDEK